MELYNIKDDYISFLKRYDDKVAENKKESRPYVGVVLDVGGIKYYAPFTSPKPKHLNMKNGKDFRKICGGHYGAINFNNMIPVPEEALLYKDINVEPDPHYRRLLQNQERAVKADYKAIMHTAVALRKLVFTDTGKLSANDKRIKERCCDFQKLEAVYMGYKKG